ncbi:adenosine deaminase/editase [Lipomyces tetrasporus]|uniref:Adenosine deaminase/editase n=1 Tax=Lipomyces tetrasporus TaxID=54092 RepID=A0AAD7QRD4_9ASCO|nr:adenosine deaminase/editase [Lipomyces tetrasporus]KAJ8100129.1 adenosine deaminase/editase [Lipomyces tetrasporus]
MMDVVATTVDSHKLATAIAELVFSVYKSCPSKCKPTVRPDGTREWTNLASVVVQTRDGELICTSMATGVKAISDSTVATAAGRILHDSHAEILAIRAFNRYLINECQNLDDDQLYFSPCVVRSDKAESQRFKRFRLDEKCRIYLLATEVPCGDASMEHVGAGTKESWDASQLERGRPLKGREYFSEIGQVRTKPGRSDAPESLSKSCTDKLCLRQFTSLLLTPTTKVMETDGAYLDALIVPKSKINPHSFTRAFGRQGRLARMSDLNGDRSFLFRPFEYWTYGLPQFEHSKESIEDENSKPSNISLIYVANILDAEAIVKGRKMGAKASSVHASSFTSRIRLTQDVIRLARMDAGSGRTMYLDLKRDSVRQRQKDIGRRALGNWWQTAEDNFVVCDRNNNKQGVIGG